MRRRAFHDPYRIDPLGLPYVPAITKRLSDYGLSFSGRKAEPDPFEWKPMGTEIDPRGLPLYPIKTPK